MIAPSFCLPPVDLCRGVRPSQAAKSRPLAKVSAGGARAAIAVAEIGPMPGMVISLRDTSSSRARRAISLSRSAILPSEAGEQVEHHSEHGAGRFRKRAGHLVFLDQVGEHRHMRRPLGRDPAIFSQVTADRVDELGSLPHQQITGPEHQTRRLLLLRSSPPRTACSAAAPLRRSPRHRSRRSSAASRTASHRRAGSAEPHGPSWASSRAQ